MYWTTVTATIYNETTPKEYENLNEEGPVIDEETFTPIDYKIGMIVGPNSEDRGRREKKDNTLLIYMFNTSDYKGDIFERVFYTLDRVWDDYAESIELEEYLLSTGKVIQQ